jgi:hypothetical protein
LDGVVGVKRVRGTIDAIVVGATLDFHFVPSGSVLVFGCPGGRARLARVEVGLWHCVLRCR